MRSAKTWWRPATGTCVLLTLVAASIVTTASPAAAVLLTTPYPSIAVEPGQNVSLQLNIDSPGAERVRLDVAEAPDGWNAYLRGGGHRVSAVHADADSAPEIELQVQVPDDAKKGSHRVVVNADAPSGDDRLVVEFDVVEQAPGAYELAAEFPELRGARDDTFRFDVALSNNTAQQARFTLAASGPEGWTIEARPSTEEKAATVSVDPSAEATIQVEADPPDDVEAGTYPVTLRATGEGAELGQELAVQIVGSGKLTLKTADERLNVSGGAGGTTTVPLVLSNTGSAPLRGVKLSGSPPTDWQVSFEPSTVAAVPPGESVRVTARITPAGEAIAGDYSITLDAKGQNANGSLDLRYAVQTTPWWGLVGILIIVAAIGSLLWTFRRFGRR